MSPTTIRIFFAVFLIAHGLMHYSLSTVPLPRPGEIHTPFLPAWWRDAVDSTWPASRLGLAPAAARTLGWVLWLAATAGYGIAGLLLLAAPGQPALWQFAAAASSIVSVLLLGLYWHPWYPVGLLIDLGLAAAVFLQWPAFRFTA